MCCVKKRLTHILIYIGFGICLGTSAVMIHISPAEADSVTDNISIYIGYFGWEETQYVEKISYSWQELDDLFGGALNTHEIVYSYYSGNRTYLAAARGFYIKDLLEYAKIDFGSVSRIDFFTKDQTVGAYRSFTKSSLFDMPRYYFPNMAADASGKLYPYNGGDVYDGAVRVEPMLAFEDYTEWDSVGCLFENLYKKSMFSAASRFHLFFGQLDPTETNTSSAAKYVYKLLITFSGTPVLSTEQTNIELKVGSDFKMTVNVSAEDSLLDEYVKENLLWSSNNEKVVSVDRFGKLTVKGKGEAVITAGFGSSSVSTEVIVSDADALSLSGGAGEAQGDNAEEASFEKPAEVQFSENNRGVYILSSELMAREENAEWVNSVLSHKYVENTGDGALNNARKSAMDKDATQLLLNPAQTPAFMAILSLILFACFAAGFGYGVADFKRKL